MSLTPAAWIARWERVARREPDAARALRVLAEVRAKKADRFRVLGFEGRHAGAGGRLRVQAFAALLSLMVEEAGGSGRFRVFGYVVEVDRFRWPGDGR